MKKVLLSLLLILIPIKIEALSNKYFEIEVPKDYIKVELKGVEDTYKWSANNENKIPNITVSVQSNPNTKFDIKKYTDKDVEDYSASLQESIIDGLKQVKIDVGVTVHDTKKTIVNNQPAIIHYADWATEESFGYTTYQKGVIFTTKNQIYSITFSTNNKEDLESNEFNNVIKSLKFKDKQIGEEGFLDSRTNQIILIGVVAGIIGYIVSALKNRKK